MRAVGIFASFFFFAELLLTPSMTLAAEAPKEIVTTQGSFPLTVDVKNASYTNTIGDNELSAVWTDPDFDPSQHVVYYVRVLEIPTPRWSTYDAKALGIMPPSVVQATIQERAWASPIWYTPDASVAKKAPSYPGLRDYLTE